MIYLEYWLFLRDDERDELLQRLLGRPSLRRPSPRRPSPRRPSPRPRPCFPDDLRPEDLESGLLFLTRTGSSGVNRMETSFFSPANILKAADNNCTES